MEIRTRWGGRQLSLAAMGVASVLAWGVAGCKGNSGSAPIVDSGGQAANGQDPADANMAQPYTGGNTGGYAASSGSGNPGNTQVLGQSEAYGGQASGESYGPDYSNGQEAPIIRQAPAGYQTQQGYADQGYSDAEEAGAQAIADTDQAPPPLPEYDQPPAPEPNYLWTPGYWNYASAGYYWVPGVWVAPPFYGALWTPPWWGWNANHWYFHRGYWGPHIGFYGGINYGFGYIGTGYYGGYWRGHDFLYNRAVTNVNINIVHNVYDRTVVYNGVHYGPRPENRVSYNGGRGGISVQPRPAELAAMHEAHYAPQPAQRQVRMEAAANRGNFFRNDGGRPAQAFATRPAGSVGNIAAAPREEAFNRAGARPGAPTAGAPNGLNRPGVTNGPSNRPNASNGVANRAGEENRPGAPAGNPANLNRPNGAETRGVGAVNRAGTPTGSAGGFNRPAQPNGGSQGASNRPAQPNAGNPGNFNRTPQPRGEGAGAFNRPTQANPGASGGFNRPTQPSESNRGGFAGARPAQGAEPGGGGLQGGRPAFNRGAEAPQSRPAPQAAPAPRQAPESRPAPAAPAVRSAPAPHAAPAAPREGGEGGGHHR